jgi:chromosome segregation ATPase
LSEELKNMRGELSEEGRAANDLLKSKKHLEDDREELMRSLEEAERNLEQEQSKTAMAQYELSNMKAEVGVLCPF